MSSPGSFVEAVQPYNLLKRPLDTVPDAAYQLTDKHLVENVNHRRAVEGHSVPPVLLGLPQRRYFMSFYRSFTVSKVRETVEWVGMVMQCECDLRRHLQYCEREERMALCLHIAEVTGLPYDTALFITNTAQLVAVEKAARDVLMGEYMNMLIEACEAQEIMTRRECELQCEPAERHGITRSETVSWLQSRQCQFERQKMHAAGHSHTSADAVMQYFEWRQQQMYQIFLFEQSERQERMWLERLERLHAGVIADMYNEAYRETYYLQLRYERSKICLAPTLSAALTAEEASARSSLLFANLDQLRAIQAQEIRNYLACRRRILRNERG